MSTSTVKPRSLKCAVLWIGVFAALLICADVFAAAGGGGGGGGGGKGGGGGGGGPGGGGGGGGPGGGGGGPGGGGGGGGGGKGGNPGNQNNETDNLDWSSSEENALEGASKESATGPLPVMICLIRENHPEDLKAAKKIGSWPSIAVSSKTRFRSVKVTAESPEGLALIKQFGPKIVPGLVWMDQYGNAIFTQPMPELAEAITNVVLNWKNTLAFVERFFKEHVTRGDALLAKSKLRSAYQEFGIISSYKGPEAKIAKDGQAKIADSWLKMAATALTFGEKAPERLAIVKGLHIDTAHLDVAAKIELALNQKPVVVVAAADGAAPDAAGAPETTPVETAAVKAPEAEMLPVDKRGLAEVARSSHATESNATDNVESNTLDASILAAYPDPRIKQAREAIERGSLAFKKAMADTMDRGAPRNELLKSAHGDFSKSIALIDEATAGKADAPVQKLVERVSMLIYACLKCQTL